MAALEIFEVVEVVFSECQDEVSRSKEENARLQRLLDVVTQPNITLHRTGLIYILSCYHHMCLESSCKRGGVDKLERLVHAAGPTFF